MDSWELDSRESDGRELDSWESDGGEWTRGKRLMFFTNI